MNSKIIKPGSDEIGIYVGRHLGNPEEFVGYGHERHIHCFFFSEKRILRSIRLSEGVFHDEDTDKWLKMIAKFRKTQRIIELLERNS